MFAQPESDWNNHLKKIAEIAQQKRNQLIEKLKDLEKIQQELSTLDGLIEKVQVLLGVETVSPSPSAPFFPARRRLSLSDDEEEKPSYLKAVEILKEVGRPMKLSEIAKEFHRRGWKLSAKNGAEVLRHSLGKRPNLFKNDQGLFSLREEVGKNKDPEPKLGK